MDIAAIAADYEGIDIYAKSTFPVEVEFGFVIADSDHTITGKIALTAHQMQDRIEICRGSTVLAHPHFDGQMCMQLKARVLNHKEINSVWFNLPLQNFRLPPKDGTLTIEAPPGEAVITAPRREPLHKQ